MADTTKKNDNKQNAHINLLESVLRGTSTFYIVEGHKYIVKFGKGSTTTAMSILRSADPGPLSQNWFLRFDNPHRGHNYPHINVRHKYTRIRDPHIPLPPGGLMIAKFCGYISKFLYLLRKVTLIYDIYRLGVAIHKDFCDGTLGNTVERVIDMTVSWSCGFLGSSIIGFVGTCLYPGIGTLIGALSGSFVGLYYGDKLAVELINEWRKLEETVQVFRRKLWAALQTSPYRTMMQY